MNTTVQLPANVMLQGAFSLESRTCTHIGTEQSYPVHPVCCGSPFGLRNSGLPPASRPSLNKLSHREHLQTSGATQVPPLLQSCIFQLPCVSSFRYFMLFISRPKPRGFRGTRLNHLNQAFVAVI